MTIEQTIEELSQIVQSTLEELSGQSWIIKQRHKRWDLHFICQLGEFEKRTGDLYLEESGLAERARIEATFIYRLYERWKAKQ